MNLYAEWDIVQILANGTRRCRNVYTVVVIRLEFNVHSVPEPLVPDRVTLDKVKAVDFSLPLIYNLRLHRRAAEKVVRRQI